MVVVLDEMYRNQDILLGGRHPARLLGAVRELLADHNLRAFGCLAEDSARRTVKPTNPNAVKWSVAGALAVLANPWGIIPPCTIKFLDDFTVAYARQHSLEAYFPAPEYFDCFEHFTDWLSHDWLLDYLDAAIREAGRGGH